MAVIITTAPLARKFTSAIARISALRYVRLFVAVVFAVYALPFFASPAYPWGSKGHEITAAIAETQLTDTARKGIKDLLPQGTTLADASTWPDKAGRQIPDMDAYHFIVRAQVYRLPASGEITATYIESARAVIRTRLAQAGARLTFLLNETLK